MGLFNRLFQKDPAKDLARAEKLLTRGDALEAVRLVVRAEENGAGASAEPLASKVREAVAASALEHAMRSKKDEYWADAAEWLEQALPYVDEGHREQFKTLIAEFHRLEDQANQAELPEALRADGGTSGPVEGEDFASDDLYDVYVESLREDVAKHFVERPQSFRHAVVSLNGGELESALELLEELTGADPHDPVLRLERGRARLAHGQIEGACEDLEAAWEQLGDEPLDHAGHLSIPALWGEAQLAQKNAAGAVERLRDLMDPRGADLEVFKVYAQALLAEKEFDEAARFLTEAWGYHPKALDLPYLLASALRGLDRSADAIATLEGVVAPSCGPAGCNVGALHVPSMYALINLHLESGDAERARELLELLTGMRGGRLGREELLIMAKYYDHVGDEDLAREARERAEEAISAPLTQAPTPVGPAGGKRAAL